MVPKKKVVGAVVKTTKVVEETVQVSVVQSKQKGAKGEEEIIEVISPSGKEPVKILVEEKSGEERGREKEKEEEKGREEEKEGDGGVEGQPTKVQEATPTPTPQKEEEKRKKTTKESETKTQEDKKTEGKTQEGKEGGRRKRKRGKIGGGGTEGYLGGEGYKIYVYRVMKQVHPDMGISSKAMTVINNLMGPGLHNIFTAFSPPVSVASSEDSDYMSVDSWRDEPSANEVDQHMEMEESEGDIGIITTFSFTIAFAYVWESL
ncbi:hypothetical protein RJ640_022474 [Escallonia rubra]|uniref:Uncharacterized protein n=1 Tax=Escallonia rubra TaxID=112253 RepID=A0AA88RNR3_9ASTE|nr:hypothetical protein RJ640_022474 [Escallonia rubra]